MGPFFIIRKGRSLVVKLYRIYIINYNALLCEN